MASLSRYDLKNMPPWPWTTAYISHSQFLIFLSQCTLMTSSIGTFSALLVICAGNCLVTDNFPAQRPVTRSFDVFFDVRLNDRLIEQSWGRWFEMPSRLSWGHCNARMWCSDDATSHDTFLAYKRKIQIISFHLPVWIWAFTAGRVIWLQWARRNCEHYQPLFWRVKSYKLYIADYTVTK